MSAELRITIAQEFRGRKLGSMLIKEIAELAAKSHVKKLLARIVTAREPLIMAFNRAGFVQVAVLKDYVQDVHQKRFADIALLVKDLTSATS